MYDIFHDWGSDLAVSSGGDLAIGSSSDTIRQRILRRLMTNQGDYIWNLDYGGGLGQFVGAPANPSKIEAVVTDQLLLERAVPSSPAPKVKTQIVSAVDGYVAVAITYADPTTNQTVTLDISPG